LQVFFSIRSERLPEQQIDYNLLFRWFAGLIVAAMVTHGDGYAKRDSKDFVRTARKLNVTPQVAGNDTIRTATSIAGPPPAAGLCHQPQAAPAHREKLRMAEADRTAATDDVTRTWQSGLAVRLQLRRPQPAPQLQTNPQPIGSCHPPQSQNHQSQISTNS
jgi:hypothetical protein